MKYEQVQECISKWKGVYDKNLERGIECIQFCSGEQYPDELKKSNTLKGKSSLKVNVIEKILMTAKGKIDEVELSLKIITEKTGENVEIAKKVLEATLLENRVKDIFKSVLYTTYEMGYGAVLCTYKQNENGTFPYIKEIKKLSKCFWDLNAPDENKIEGGYCGVINYIPYYSLSSEDKRALKLDKERSFKEIVEVIDFWHAEYKEVEMYLDKNSFKWSEVKTKGALQKYTYKKRIIYYTRFINKKESIKKQRWVCDNYLPLVYWKGFEYRIGESVMTMPFIFKLMGIQVALNLTLSSIVDNMIQLNGKIIIVPKKDPALAQDAASILKANTGILVSPVNTATGESSKIDVIPPQGFDANIVASLTTLQNQMEYVAEVTQGVANSNAQIETTSGLHAKIMQGDLTTKCRLENHLLGINAVGKIFKEMIPKVMNYRSNIGGIVLNKRKSEYVIENDIYNIFKDIDFKIEYGVTSSIEKQQNLMQVERFMQTNPDILQNNPEIRALLLIQQIEYSDYPNKELLEKLLKSSFNKGLRDLIDGKISINEYEKIKEEEMQKIAEQQKEQDQGPQIDPYQQAKLELEEKRVEMEGERLKMDNEKTRSKIFNDQRSIQIKEGELQLKANPPEKEVIYERE
jgi:hypothetical protein